MISAVAASSIVASENPADLGLQDLLVIAVKGPSLPTLAPSLKPLIGPQTIILPAMNGIPWWFCLVDGPCRPFALTTVDPEGTIATNLPLAQTFGCVVHIGASCPAPGLVQHAMGRELIIGEALGGLSPRVESVACLLGKGPAQAESGDVPLFVGGPDEALDALGDVFGVIGAGVHRMGGVEAAAAFKLVSNLIGMTNLAVLAEGYLLCRRAGVDDATFTAALADTGGWSYQADLRLPWMMAGDFASRFPMELGLKDVRLAVDMAGQWAVPAPVGAATMTQLAAAVAQGYGGEDVDAVVKVVDPRGTIRGAGA